MQFQGETNNSTNRNLLLLIAAFAAVYIFWGSTYLAIKYAIDTLPPFLMAGSRFMFAGSLLYIWARLSPDFESPTFAHWRTSFAVGTLLLLGGNGAVVFAQHYISSSLAALLVATEPFFIVLLSWVWLKGVRPSPKVVFGLLLGFAGVWLLISGQGASNGTTFSEGGQWLGTLAVILGAMSWAAGSIYGLRAAVPKSSVLSAGMQMMSGGLVLFIVSMFTGEWQTFSVEQVSTRSWFALSYLIVFGSLIGFTAYSWLLKNAQPAMVATYAYVNPVIAVLLGWLIAGEFLSTQMLIGAAIVIASVALITSKHSGKPDAEVKKLEFPKASRSDSGNYSTSS